MSLIRAERLRSVRRVLGRGLPEIAGRSRQGASRWLERAGVTRPASSGARDSLDVDRLRHEWTGRFFGEEAVDETRLPVAGRLQDAWTEMIVRADRLCDGHFDFLGHRRLSFGQPIDWHLDPIAGRRSPLVHWSRLDPLDASVVGDSKIVWELNRHQWLVHLGEAYRLTGDERYAVVCATRLRAWMRANPPGFGINWTSSLEVALRLVAWCWTIQLFRRADAMSPWLFAELARWIAIHATRVEKYLSYYFSPNTHLTGEALGLFYAGTLFREHDKAAAWRTRGARVLVEEIERQVHPDGVYFEQSTYYQRYTVEIYLHFLILAARNGIAVPPVVAERVQAMLDFLLSVRHPNGSMPQIGDSDGGWILPFELRGSDDLRGVFSTAAAFFLRPDYAWAAGGPTLETFWLLGEDGLTAFDALDPSPPERPPSSVFRDGGYVVMRSGWAPDDHQLLFDVGPLGCSHSGGHGHADLLSVQCAAFGEPYLADAGTGSYTAAPAWRDHFRTTVAHSTVLVDGLGQAVPAGPFGWHARPRAHLRRWVSTAAYDLADADHAAYQTLADPVVHRRRVLYIKPRYWVLVDDLDGKEEHQVDLGFQFARLSVTPEADSWVRARGKGGRGLAVGAWCTTPLERSIAAGALDPIRGWLSPEYDQARPAPLVTYSVVTRLPLRIVSAIVPLADARQSLPSLSELFSCVALLES